VLGNNCSPGGLQLEDSLFLHISCPTDLLKTMGTLKMREWKMRYDMAYFVFYNSEGVEFRTNERLF